MVVFVFVEGSAVVVVFADVEFAAEDGLDSLLLHGIEEVDCAKDVSVVGHCGSSLADFAEVACEFVDIAGAIEKRVIGVKMKVGKLCCHASILRRLYRSLREDKGGPNSSGFLLNYKYFRVMR
jgi:hypothetical protein